MKFLIVGLGNIGPEYVGTRHNIGFRMVDALAEELGAEWSSCRYGDKCDVRIKNQQALLLKPSTYMNLSGQAVRYWMQQEKIEADHLLVLVDDLNLPVGTLRLKGQGSAGGHNGLKNIAELLGTEKYARLRFGIGSDYAHGAQIGFVLGKFTAEEEEVIGERLKTVVEACKSFCLQGIERTMNMCNMKASASAPG